MPTQEKVTATASSWSDEYDMPNGYTGRIEETELWDCDILNTENAYVSDEPEVVKVSLQLKQIELETSNTDADEQMLKKIAEQQLQQPTIIEVSTEPSEFASQYGEEVCSLFLQDISYLLEGHEVGEGVTIKSAGWDWDEVKVVN